MLVDRHGRVGPKRCRPTSWRVVIRGITPIFFLLVSPGLAGQNGEGLSAPTGVEASDGVYATKVGICWDHIRNATTYEVFRATTDDAASAMSVGTTASIIFYDSTAEPAQNYFYWVQAQDGNRRSSLSVSDQGLRAVGEIPVAGFILPRPLEPPPVPLENPVTGARVYLGRRSSGMSSFPRRERSLAAPATRGVAAARTRGPVRRLLAPRTRDRTACSVQTMTSWDRRACR